MSIVGSEQWMYSSGAEFYDFPIEQSLRFEDGDSAKLTRTPASASNRQTWTWSGWLKRSNLNTKQTFFCSTAGDYNLHFATDNKLKFEGAYGTTATDAVFRDVSSFYHIVAIHDTTEVTSSDRFKIYVNGVQQTTSGSYPSGDGVINNTVEHGIGGQASVNFFDGYMAEVNFIDGQALDPTSFGELKSGIWIPKDTADLTFGTNGFRLQFGDTTEASGFNTVTYTGNGGTQSISGVGFSSAPDMVWIKQRSSPADNHRLFNSVVGATKYLVPDDTYTETTDANTLTSFDNDGFTLGSSGIVNESGKEFVAWTWDAGSGSAASNTDGSITSTVKANTDYGFSIVSYTGTGANATVGHGLGVAPQLYIVKYRNAAGDWKVYSEDVGNTYQGFLNGPDAFQNTGASIWNNTSPTSSVFSIGTNGGVNTNGGNYIAYCFAEKTGYSSISSYTGNGSASGPTITTGFRPAFVMIKRTDSANSWTMQDNTRDTSNPIDLYLLADDPGAEGTSGLSVDFLSDGFQIKTTSAAINASGGSYIYMAFADTRNAAFWKDTSGQGNDWQPNNLVFSDVVPDGTNNFGTWNPLVPTTGYTFSEGNLKALAGTADYGAAGGMFTPKTGKWYFEFCNSGNGGTTGRKVCGVASSQIVVGNDKQDSSIASGIEWSPTGGTAAIYAFRENGDKCSISATTAYGSDDAQTIGDVVGVALDLDNSAIYFSVNGVWQNSGDPTSGASQTGAAFTSLADDNYTIMMHQWEASHAWTHNGGQDSTFAGLKAAGGNADENGYGDFAYAPPSGFLSLCSANLPSGAINTLADETPEDYFNTVLWTGTGSSNSVTGVGFEPTLTWIKNRSGVYDNKLLDLIRGATKILSSNLTSAEATEASGLTSFDADGFTVGSQAAYNGSGNSMVAWNWKAGGSGVSNTDGSITSTVSVGATSQQNWFSVVSYTGNGTGGATVGHGLDGTVPDMIIVKSRDNARDWRVYHSSLGSAYTLDLNTTNAVAGPSTAYWNSTDPTSSVFSIGSVTTVNGSGEDYIAYCFANAEGLCRAGSYVGNGSADGTFVHCGFRPAFVLLKKSSASGDNWSMYDNKRDTDNTVREYLIPNSSQAAGATDTMDFVSNGFKVRNSGAYINTSGSSYIYLALAEQPFKFANAR